MISRQDTETPTHCKHIQICIEKSISQGKKLPANLDPDAEEGDVSDEDTGDEDEDEDDENDDDNTQANALLAIQLYGCIAV